VLQGSSLFEYKEEAVPKKDSPLRVLRLKNVVVRSLEESSHKHTFGLYTISPEKLLAVFQTASQEGKKVWMDAISSSQADMLASSSGETDEECQSGDEPFGSPNTSRKSSLGIVETDEGETAEESE